MRGLASILIMKNGAGSSIACQILARTFSTPFCSFCSPTQRGQNEAFYILQYRESRYSKSSRFCDRLYRKMSHFAPNSYMRFLPLLVAARMFKALVFDTCGSLQLISTSSHVKEQWRRRLGIGSFQNVARCATEARRMSLVNTTMSMLYDGQHLVSLIAF
jgi:hypothetical protein